MKGCRNEGRDEGRGAGARPSTCPPAPRERVGACLPCGQPRWGRPLRTRGLSQERQAAQRPGRRSAVKCCISHKGGLQWALLSEIRETGNTELSFNTHLIFMELQQHQPPCGEHSRSTGREHNSPANGCELGKHSHLVHKTAPRTGNARGGCWDRDHPGFRPGSLASGVTLSKSHTQAGPQRPPPGQGAGRKWDHKEEGGLD